MDDDVLIATQFDGKPITREHGGPARIIIPKLYAWKGAKFVKSIEFAAEDRPGDERYETTLAAASNDAVDAASRQEALEQAVTALPDHQRVPLVLFHFEDMSYKEIAAALGISLAKVKTDIHRGREVLKRAMTGVV